MRCSAGDDAVHADAHLLAIAHLLGLSSGPFRVFAADIAAGAEPASRTGHDQAAQTVFFDIAIERCDKIAAHRVRVGVQLIRAVESDRRDGGFRRLEQDGAIGHGGFPRAAGYGNMAPEQPQGRGTMSDYPDILYDVKDRVATITLNRPDRLNAYTERMAGNIRVAMAEASDDPNVRVIVLTGAGRGFCAGADMDVLSRRLRRAANARQSAHGDADIGDALRPPPMARSRRRIRRHAERFAYFMRPRSRSSPRSTARRGHRLDHGALCRYAFRQRRRGAHDVVRAARVDRRARHLLAAAAADRAGATRSTCCSPPARSRAAGGQATWASSTRSSRPRHFMDNVHGVCAAVWPSTVSPRSMAVMKAQVWKSYFQDLRRGAGDGRRGNAAELRPWPDFKEGVAHFLEKRAPKFADI